MNIADQFIQDTREFADAVDRLRFQSPVQFVYNPLQYAWSAHEQYLRRYLRGNQRLLFLGMNPGPFGMAQTGVPFGEVAAVRDWLGISEAVQRPPREHPRKPVLGFDCNRSEVSGRRLWGLFETRFGKPQQFFKSHFVYNYCPLVFLDGGVTGRNLTPETLSGPAVKQLQHLCDRHLLRLLDCCGAEVAIGIGNYAERRLKIALEGRPIQVARILHPSPASPKANRDWAGAATTEMNRLGLW